MSSAWGCNRAWPVGASVVLVTVGEKTEWLPREDAAAEGSISEDGDLNESRYCMEKRNYSYGFGESICWEACPGDAGCAQKMTAAAGVSLIP